MKQSRRGFLSSLAALVFAPFMKEKAKPDYCTLAFHATKFRVESGAMIIEGVELVDVKTLDFSPPVFDDVIIDDRFLVGELDPLLRFKSK